MNVKENDNQEGTLPQQSESDTSLDTSMSIMLMIK